MAQLSRRDTSVTPHVWRRGAFIPEEPPPGPPQSIETRRTLIGYPEQIDNRLGVFLNRPLYACSHLHAGGGAVTGRPVYRTAVENGLIAQANNPWFPRLQVMGGLIIANKSTQGPGQGEEFTDISGGALNSEIDWFADLLFDHIGEHLNDAHPVHGRPMKGWDIFAWNPMHEWQLVNSPWTTQFPNSADKVDASSANFGTAFRYWLDRMYARHPELAPGEDMHFLVVMNGVFNTAKEETWVDDWPGDDYVDVISQDVYDSAGAPNTAGTPAYWAKSRDQILHDRSTSIYGFQVPFADADQSHPWVIDINNGNAAGGHLHGGRHVPKTFAWTEMGVYAADKNNDNVVDNTGGLDNPGLAEMWADVVDGEQAKQLLGDQVTYGTRVHWLNPFDVNHGAARTAHRFTSYPEAGKFSYNYVQHRAAMRTFFGGSD